MSRASAYVRRFDGSHVGHGIYDGTSDILMPLLCENDHEPWDVYYDRTPWRGGLNYWDALQACEHQGAVGYAYSSYGGGFYWPVEFCEECMVIHGPLDWDAQFDMPPGNGYWPRDGEPPIEADEVVLRRALNRGAA